MDDATRAAAYAAADFDAPHQYFADEFVARFGELHAGHERSTPVILDLGCGPGDVTVRLARALPGTSLVGVDGAAAMLEEGRRRVAREDLGDRIELRHRHLPDPTLPTAAFDAVVSNSLLHHLADPAVLWTTVASTAVPGAPVLVMDLLRPDSPTEVDRLVEQYAAGEDPVLVEDFRASLHASYRPREVEAQLAEAGLGHLTVEIVSDRHLVAAGHAAR